MIETLAIMYTISQDILQNHSNIFWKVYLVIFTLIFITAVTLVKYWLVFTIPYSESILNHQILPLGDGFLFMTLRFPLFVYECRTWFFTTYSLVRKIRQSTNIASKIFWETVALLRRKLRWKVTDRYCIKVAIIYRQEERKEIPDFKEIIQKS